MEAITIIAESLASQNFKRCYGIVGVPVIELSMAMQQVGIHFIGFRNDQACSYSAGAEGYLTGRPGLCLTVSGPGLTNAISGLGNAQVNSWPMLLLAGSYDQSETGMGSFQELDQVDAVRSFVKWGVRVTHLREIPRIVERAVRISMTGRPGPVYIDLPMNILRSSLDEKVVYPPLFVGQKPPLPYQDQVDDAASLLRNAARPLIIIGKGAAYADASEEIRRFIRQSKLPFLQSPMGKGVADEESEQNVASARSTALLNADVILLLGARLNWIMHFGLPPRYSKDVKIIQVDIDALAIGDNVTPAVGIAADVKAFIIQLSTVLNQWQFSQQEWISTLQQGINKNQKQTEEFAKSPELNYYTTMNRLKQTIPRESILIAEGMLTMDVARTILPSYLPRKRLDAGTWGTMGIGLPFAIAAKACFPELPVYCVLGDSAFGFSAMEFETAIRHKLDLQIFIVNNNGISFGAEELPEDPKSISPLNLNPNTRYELIAQAFGAIGYEARSIDQLDQLLQNFRNPQTSQLLNIRIKSDSGKKPQERSWWDAKL